MANREEMLKQTQRFRHTLDAMEHVMRDGNAEALEGLIRSASDARAGWQMNAADAAHAPLSAAVARGAAPAMFTTPFLDLPPLRRGRRHGAPARLEEHLEPRAAAGRPRRGHDAHRTTCSTPTTRG